MYSSASGPRFSSGNENGYTKNCAIRLLLPTSYFVVSVWSPYAPDALDRLAVDVGWQTPVAATWMLSRFVVFIAMERWHGWHGRWWLVAVGAFGMVGGIGTALIAPLVGVEPPPHSLNDYKAIKFPHLTGY